ncbi:MAG: hypothetical protein IJ527_08090 [Prevotella sp.]|nr:hypothetical protein [Prevotella sp.]
MIDFLSDLIAYPIVGVINMFDHLVSFGGVEASNETIDQVDRLVKPNMVAEWRYKINHALGGTRTYDDYNKQENQEFIGCCCGCGCLGALALFVVLLIFLVILSF